MHGKKRGLPFAPMGGGQPGSLRCGQRTVTFVENRVNQPVEPAAFSLPRLGVQRGDKVQDRRTRPMCQYQ
jgi:hypothetical protein